MSDKLSDIEPCRFCGSKHVEVWSDAFVHCWACAADGPVCSSAQEAIAAWNRPTVPAPAGWKSVPIEATDEIIAAMQKHCGVLLTDDMEINVGSRYTACEYALHCAWKEALAVSPSAHTEPLSEARKQEIAKSRFTGAVDICKALQCIDDALKESDA